MLQLLLACGLGLACAQPHANRSCAVGPECTVCELCCVGAELLPEHCDRCVELHCVEKPHEEPGESAADLLGHLLDFVRDHMEQCLTVLAALPIVGRLSDFSVGAARRRCCPRRKVIVMSSPEEGTRRADGRGPYNERVMDKVAELQQQGRLKMGFDRAGTMASRPQRRRGWPSKARALMGFWS